jgi:hypothetical protein
MAGEVWPMEWRRRPGNWSKAGSYVVSVRARRKRQRTKCKLGERERRSLDAPVN